MNSKFKDYTKRTGWLEETTSKADFYKVLGMIIGVIGILMIMIWI